jgi:hypothetical protein
MNEQLDNAIVDRIITVVDGMFRADPLKAQTLFEFKVNVNDEFVQIVPTCERNQRCNFVGLFHVLNALMSPVQTRKHKGCSRLSLIKKGHDIRVVKTEELE